MRHTKCLSRPFSGLLILSLVFSLLSGSGTAFAAQTDPTPATASTESADVTSFVGTSVTTDSIAPESYSLSTYSEGSTDSDKDLNQHVVLTLNYSDTVAITDETALNDAIFGATPTLTIKIAGYSINSASYYRPCTYSADGNSLLIDIGNCVTTTDGVTSASFTAMYNGSFTASGSLSGISIGDTSTDSAVSIAETRIPIGITLTPVSGWDTNSVTVQVSHTANVRGMYHFVVYKVTDDTTSPVTVLPATTAPGQLNAYTLTSHAHLFYSMSASTLAANMVSVMSSSLLSGYTATIDNDTINVTSTNSSDKLRIYIYDDNFIQSNDCTLNMADPEVSFASTSSSLSGTGSIYYQLNVANADTFAYWAANATVQVDGVSYKVVTSEPATYTTTDKSGNPVYYAYLEKSGSKFYLNLSSTPIDCSGGQATTHSIAITSAIGDPIQQDVTVKSYAAHSFRVRYIDGDGNILSSKVWSMDELKEKFNNVTQDYNTACTMVGVRTFHAEGVLLNDLLSAAGITLDDSMTLQIRTNDSTVSGVNDPDDTVGQLSEGYYKSGTFAESDLYADRYYYPAIYDAETTYDTLNASTIYDTLKSTKGQLLKDDETQAALRSTLAATATKQKVTPLIAWQYSETVFGADGNPASTVYDTLASSEKSFRFLFGLKEENSAVSTQVTTWSATYEAFGIDVIASEYHPVADTENLISAIGTVTLNSKNAITAARAAYDKLPEAVQAKISNYQLLTAAEASYQKLVKASETVSVTKVTLSASKLSLLTGQSKTITAAVAPSNATVKTVVWTSSNPSVATVSNGKIVAKKAGTATITATAADGSKIAASCKVTVQKPAVSLNLKSIKLQVKTSTSVLQASGLKSGDSIASYTSSNSKIVKVSKTGKLTATSKTGTATITVKTKYGATATCKVTVQKGQIVTKSLSVNQTKVALKKGKTFAIKVTRNPINATDKISYKSSNSKIATVSSKGVITGKKKGTCTITVKTESGKSKKISITIK